MAHMKLLERLLKPPSDRGRRVPGLGVPRPRTALCIPPSKPSYPYVPPSASATPQHMLTNALLVLIFACHALAVVVGSERREIALAPAQEYSLPKHPRIDAQTPLEVTNRLATGTAVSVRARPTTVYRPRNLDALQHARSRSLRLQESEPIEWEPVDIMAPDVEDRHTLAQLARMSGNAYAQLGQNNWYDIDPVWNTVRMSLQKALRI